MSLELCIVMPAYNEGEVIADVVEKWTRVLRENFGPEKSRLIIVNDGSKDNTGDILQQLSAENEYLIGVDQPNGGHGNAVVNAYKKALEIGPKYVFQTDSDDQFEADEMMGFWKRRKETPFILGYRKVRYDAPIRLIITRIVRWVLRLYYGVSIPDSNIPFRLIESQYLQTLINRLPKPLPFAPNIFLSVMAVRDGNDTLNIPITHKDRHTGEVSIKKMKLLKVCMKSYRELRDFRKQLKQGK